MGDNLPYWLVTQVESSSSKSVVCVQYKLRYKMGVILTTQQGKVRHGQFKPNKPLNPSWKGLAKSILV